MGFGMKSGKILSKPLGSVWPKTDTLTSLCFSFLIQKLESINLLNAKHCLKSWELNIKNTTGPNSQKDYIPIGGKRDFFFN